jgi:hypothetical protein
MKYYFDPDLGVRAFESDGSQDFLITENMRAMTPAEVEAHLNPPITYKKALDSLNSMYESDVAKFNNAFALSLLSDGPSEVAKIAAIRTEYEARRTKHTADLAALKTQYGV